MSVRILFKIKLLIICATVSQARRQIGDGGGLHLQEALHLGTSSGNSRDECTWRMDGDFCPDPLITYTLYTRNAASGEEEAKSATIDIMSPSWLHSNGWRQSQETVVLVHGYGGTADHLPTGVLRDAYLTNGSYNVIVVDWGQLARIPCYVSAVHNVKAVAKCLADLYTFLRNSGVDMQTTTCVGHSLGAHVCGVTANFLQFRLHRIIGIDPARPLVRNNPKSKLDAGDAEIVQVMHTSSNYGDPKKIGHVDFYFNGGRSQPFCSNAPNEELCSHIRSVCYLAESLFPESIRYATHCRRRNIKADEYEGKALSNRVSNMHSVPIGQHTPDGVLGSYCISNHDAPYCSQKNSTERGSSYCCPPMLLSNVTEISTNSTQNLQDITTLTNDLSLEEHQ